MKKTLFLTAVLGAVFAAPVMAEGYGWTTAEETLTPAKNDVAIVYEKTISMNGSTSETISGDVKVVSTGDSSLSTNLGTADSLYISGGRLQVEDGTKLGSNPIFIKGGQLWYKGGNLSNDIYIGTSTYGGGENGDKAAMRIQNSSAFSGNIIVGEDARLNVTGATATFSGAISAQDRTLSLTAFYGGGTMNLNGANNIGTLDIAETTIGAWSSSLTVNINGATTAKKVTIGNGTSAILNIGNSGSLTAESISIGANGVFNRNAGAVGKLDLSNVTAVAGGRLVLSNLANNATGTVVKVADDFSGTLAVLGGQLGANSTEKNLGNATIRLNGGSLTFINNQTAESNVLSNDVELFANSTIQVWGSTHNSKMTGTLNGAGKTLTKTDGGTVALAGTTTLGSLVVNGGKVRFLGDTEKTIGSMSGSFIVGGNFGVTSADTQTVQLTWDKEGNSGTITSGVFEVTDMDMSVDNTASGCVTLASGVKMIVTDNTIWYSTRGASLLVKEGAELVNNGFSIKGVGNGATFGTNGTPSGQGNVASVMGSNVMKVSDADITYSGSGESTISTVLRGSKLSTEEGAGKLIIATAAELTGVDAKSAISVKADTTVSGTANFAAALTVENGATLSLIKEPTTIETLTLNSGTITVGTVGDEATLTTSNLTVQGTNSTINADLVISNGGHLDFSAGTPLTLGCTLTLGDNLTLTLNSVQQATIAESGMVELFSDVESLIVGGQTYTMSDAQVVIDGYQFANFYQPNHQVVYRNGSVYVTPEPATATLSLLALAALVSRRRRKA